MELGCLYWNVDVWSALALPSCTLAPYGMWNLEMGMEMDWFGGAWWRFA